MAANKSVTILTPNGRRPNVKITPNTTILQALEEVCEKYNFNPEEYDLKHYNKILDVNLTFRYANLSNNACLEMVKCKNPRKVSNVTICIQLENGSRLTGEYPPNENVENILKNLGVEYNVESAVIIFTQREIYGKEFETVTLKSLGLATGKALFRLLARNPEKLKEQAHVYVPPQPKVAKTEEDDTKFKPHPIIDPNNKKNLDPISIIKAEKKNNDEPVNEIKKEDKTESKIEQEILKKVCTSDLKQQVNKEEIPMEIDKNDEVEINKSLKEEDVQEEIKVEFLGERSALLFNQAGAKAIHQDDIPDSFFELTVKDAQTLLRDVKKMQSKLQDSPLLTLAQRELEKDKAKLNRLHKYQQAVIRIQFPNQLVLQALFGPLETVQAVKDFVKNYLEHPDSEFALYTAPPRCDLNSEDRLFDCDLVPSAIIYYSGSSDLKTEMKLKLTDPTAASFQAVKTRLTTTRNDSGLMEDDEPALSISSLPSTSTTSTINNGTIDSRPGPSRPQPQKSQMPKWFKLSTK